MVDHSTHSQPPPDSEEEQEDQGLDENKAAKQAQQAFAEEVPEAQMISSMLQIIGGLGLLHVSNRAQVIEAFRTLNSKHFIHNVLDLKDPEKLREIQQALQIAGKEMTDKKKRWDKQGKKQDYVDVGIGKLKQKLSFSDYQRRVQAVKIARIFHNKVNAEIITEKFRNAKSVFGLNDENAFKLKRGLAEWLKKNPGATINDYLSIHGKRYYCEENSLDEKRLNGQQKEDLKKKSVDLHKKNEETVKKTQNSEETIGRYKAGRRVVRDTLNPNVPSPQLDYQLSQSVLNGTYQQKTQLIPQQQPTTPPVRVIPQPIITKIPSKIILPNFDIKSRIANFLAKSAALQAFRLAMRNAIAYSLKALRSAGLRSVAKLGLSFARSSLSFLFKTGSRLAIKAGLTAAGAAASLGTTLLAQAGLELLKKIPGVGKIAQIFDDAVLGVVKWGAILAVGSVVVVFILIIFGTDSLFSTNTASNPMIIPQIAQSAIQKYSWKEFEEKYLTTAYSP